MTEARCYIVDFRDARRGRKPRSARNAALGSGQAKDRDSFRAFWEIMALQTQ